MSNENQTEVQKKAVSQAEYEKRVEIEAANLMYFEYMKKAEAFEEAKAFVDDFVKPDYNNWEGAEEFETRFMEIVEKKFS